MEIRCPHCQFARTVDPDKVPDRAVRVTCPKCGQGFGFEKPARPAASETPSRIICPACGLEQDVAESCQGCGVNFSRLDARNRDREMAAFELAALRQQAGETSPALRPKAGFWIRVVASMIDSGLLFVVQFILGLALGLAVGGLNEGVEIVTEVDVVVWLFGATLSVAYAVFFTGYCGQTPGKMALRIKVIRTDGSDIGYGRAALREVLGKFLSSILLGIGYLMVAFDRQKQGLHDRIADTFVIKL